MNKRSFCKFFIILTFLSALIFNSAKVSIAAESAIASTDAIVLPEVKNYETSEVCSLKSGLNSEEISLGDKKGPKFASCGPSSFAFDKNEKLYIVDAMNFKVIVIDNGKVVKVLKYPEGETKKHRFYISDIAVSNDGKTIYLLNQTLKSIFVMNENGKIKNEIKLSGQTARPSKIFIAANGNIVIRDEGGIKTLVYSAAGKVLGRLAGGDISNITNKEDFLYALGEFDKEGRDILLMDPISNRKSKVFAKLTKVIKETKPYDYQIIGMDAKQNLYASIVEKIKEDVIQTMLYKFSKDGKVVSRTKIMPFKQLWNTVPTRYFVISPAGNLYAFAADDKLEKLVIYKITSK
ncbi:MAG TPA: hypothetical protein PKK26_07320 [Candidatus Wallbacteria bacterium]|nr:hypothetical protein [Candidatus Wallbacteria bacterium]